MDRPEDGEIRVQTSPGRKNLSGEECVKGWLGTSNDWHQDACGEFASLEEAQEEMTRRGFTEVVDNEDYLDEGILEVRRTKNGVREQWRADHWLRNAMSAQQIAESFNLSKRSTDNDIARAIEELEKEASQHNVRLYKTEEAFRSVIEDLEEEKVFIVESDEENSSDIWWEEYDQCENNPWRTKISSDTLQCEWSVLSEKEVDEFIGFCEELAGWYEGPEHAPHPLRVTEKTVEEVIEMDAEGLAYLYYIGDYQWDTPNKDDESELENTLGRKPTEDEFGSWRVAFGKELERLTEEKRLEELGITSEDLEEAREHEEELRTALVLR
jgi:predicted DNA-binding protein YlxM (UPF0122 family)